MKARRPFAERARQMSHEDLKLMRQLNITSEADKRVIDQELQRERRAKRRTVPPTPEELSNARRQAALKRWGKK